MKKVLLLLTLVFSLSAYAQSSAVADQPVRKVKVFPNPATTVVNILGLQNSSKAEIMITDAYGNTVLEHHWAIKNNALNIPITALNDGIYMVTIRSQEQQVQTKFYKQ